MRIANIDISIKKLIFLIIMFSFFVTSNTYAFLFLQENINFDLATAGCLEVNYSAQEINTAELVTTTNYLEGAHTIVSLSKDEDCQIYTEASIYIHTNDTITAPINDIRALKYKVLLGDLVLSEGVITKVVDKDTKLATVELTNEVKNYDIYVWIDSELSQGAYHETTYSGYIYAESVQSSTLGIPNVPELTEGLVPVMYDESISNWVVGDITNLNSSYEWYDYENKKWANAVLVNDTLRANLSVDANGAYVPGQVVGDTESEGVLAFYVWIPRFKYKVWNINKVADSTQYGYDAYNNGIDIVFENGSQTTGTINCSYDFAVIDGGLSETCDGSNGDYYTHPAFTFGNSGSKQLNGFWFGKFELSSQNTTSNDGGGSSTTSIPRILPSVYSWKRNSISEYFYVVKQMQKENNIYGLSTDLNVVDTHLITNMEWGAVAYLTNSKYGSCTNGTCAEVGLNACENLKTGCGPIELGNNSITSTTCNEYNSTLGLTSSTTGNIYGVYDMNGGAYEYVMGNTSLSSGKYEYNAGEDASNNFEYNELNKKYLITYAYGTTNKDQIAYNRGRLGDATSEVVTASGYTWYDDWGYFTYKARPWFLRGDYIDDTTGAGVFAFDFFTGAEGWSGVSSRASLVVY